MVAVRSLSYAAPAWATRSVPEDGGVTHERVSAIRPGVADPWGAAPDGVRPTEVSVSVTDRLEDGEWVRTPPTVQVEGGSYGLEAAHLLRDALDEAITVLEGDIPGADASSGADARPGGPGQPA